jgi:GNAT superfamily N-acetyltransferase
LFKETNMEEIILRKAERSDFEEISRWIVEVSQLPEQQCIHSWSGEDSHTLCEQLLYYLEDAELVYVIAHQGSQLVGAMGSEYDEGLGRGWLHGPHATVDGWEEVASQLYNRLMEELPAEITQFGAYMNIENVRGRGFYRSRGFEECEHLNYDYWWNPDHQKLEVSGEVELLKTPHHESFIELYAEIFPNGYYSGERLVEMNGSSHQVFVVSEGEKVLGFAVISVDESGSNGEVQFLGVREDCRNGGLGRKLLVSAVTWLHEMAKVSRVCLNVGENLSHAKRLYESVGFELRYTGVGLKKLLLSLPSLICLGISLTTSRRKTI